MKKSPDLGDFRYKICKLSGAALDLPQTTLQIDTFCRHLKLHHKGLLLAGSGKYYLQVRKTRFFGTIHLICKK